jgi:DNA-binding response OmpR family regulator
VSSVLIVDDDPDQVWLARYLLEREGHECAAADGEEVAWKSMLSSPPDVVLLDLHLGAGDGWRLLERMRADPRIQALPVVVMSAARDDEVADRARSFGAEYLDKTLIASQLVARVRTAIATA